jgi:hypothetical protein
MRPRFTPESRLGRWGILDVVATMSTDQVLFSAGGTEEKELKPSVNLTFFDGGSFQWNFTRNFERITRAFNVSGVNEAGSVSLQVPVGDYRSGRTSFSFSSDRSKPFSGNLSYNWGDYYGGTRKEFSLTARHHLGYRLFTIFTYTRNNVSLPPGSLHTDQTGLTVEYSFNPKMSLSTFVQYNNQSDQLSSNIRFRLIHHPLSDIFLVYNDLRDRARQKTDWGLSLKYTRLFSF